MIDIYHNTKSDISKSLLSIIRGQGRVESKMYKNSLKSINALEFVLFSKEIDKSDDLRRLEVAKVIIGTLTKRFEQIYQWQDSNALRDLVKDPKWVNATILDALIQSSYKLKEWRVGDAAGMSKKYKNRPNNNRLEYYTSGLSSEAIKAILLTYQKIINETSDFNKNAIKQGASKDIKRINKYLKTALAQLQKIKDEDFTSKNAKRLYNTLDKLHNMYYISLINRLQINSKIIEADGD